MNLSKELKKKRDAEDRLRCSSPRPVYMEKPTGEQSFVDTSKFATKTELAGKADINHNHDATYATLSHNHDDLYVKIGQLIESKYFEPLCYNAEILFSPDGDILMGEVI